MAPDDEPDDTHGALTALRGLGAERAAEDEAERTAVHGSPVEQAVLALQLLEERRRPTAAERHLLAIPRTPDDPALLPRVLEEREHEHVEQIVERLEPQLVVDAWLDQVARGAGYRTLERAASVFARVADIEGFVTRLHAMLTSTQASQRRLVRDMVIASGRNDDVLADVLRVIVTDEVVPRAVAEDALRIAAPIGARSEPAGARSEPAGARSEPAGARLEPAAVMIAARIRRDRSQRIADALSPLPLEERVAAARAVSSHTLAEVVATARSPLLVASATLELERATSPSERAEWARALLACDPTSAPAYLARMRNRPGWGSVLGELPPPAAEPLVDLTSPIADVRRRALDALSSAPRRDHVQALVLATELDCYVTREIERTSWRWLEVTEWLPLLLPYGAPGAGDRLLVSLPPITELHALRARTLLDELIETGVGRRPFAELQQLTAELQQLAARGAEAYAKELGVPPLDATAIAELEAVEAAVIARG